MDREQQVTRIGNFRLGNGDTFPGQLVLDGRDTYLELYGDQPFNLGVAQDCILGSLYDQTKLSLLQCVTVHTTDSYRDGHRHATLEVFPHFVLEGTEHLSSTEPRIRKTVIFIEDAVPLFYDFDAFGIILDANTIMRQIAAQDTRGRRLPVGPRPVVTFFAGQREIISVGTPIGCFRANHNPSFPLGGPGGVSIDNEISISLDFDSPIDFHGCFDCTQRLLAFLDVVLGRQQTIIKQYVIVGKGDSTTSLRIHWSHAPVQGPGRHDNHRRPHPADVVVSPVEHRNEFAVVMSAWLTNDEERRDARQQFHGSFIQGNRFMTDRLVASANMFDLLPPSALPSDVILAVEVSLARDLARDLFAKLPVSLERDSILSALGRIGKASLKHKVRQRGELITYAAPKSFPNLDVVLDEAVNCRNHFVHGSQTRIDYARRQDLVPFLVRSLEFVFACSDLLDCGWDIRRFLREGTTGSHPFGSYKARYAAEVGELLRALH